MQSLELCPDHVSIIDEGTSAGVSLVHGTRQSLSVVVGAGMVMPSISKLHIAQKLG